MSTPNQLSNRIKEVFIDGDWVAKTNYKTLLATISIEEATSSIGDHNSIALILFHVNYYIEGLNQVYNGGQLTIKDKHSFEMQVINNDNEWQYLINKLLTNATQFSGLVEAMNIQQLNSPFIRSEYGTNLRNIEAVIEHAYYHLGQIKILKKIINETQK